jgi:hypothetical protein
MSDARICIVSIENVKRAPYVSQYVRCLHGRPFDFLYWDRDLNNDQIGQDKSYSYRHQVRHGEPSIGQRWEKLTGYLGFRKYASRVLSQGGYERVVCLTGNCAVLLSNVLLKKYPGRFIIDIRDYWHEDNRYYHDIEQRLIEASAFPVISSPAYQKFLGNHEFRVMHNSQILTDEERSVADHPHERPYHIVCVGAAKNLPYDRSVIDLFANDSRFRLSFRGRGYDALRKYISEKGIDNVEATGEFDFARTLEQYRDADMVLSMYGNGSPYWDYALANKLYFAAQLGLPILVCADTAMAEFTEKYDLGIAIDPGIRQSKDKVAELFEPRIVSKREAGRQSFLSKVQMDNGRTFSDITEFFDI